MKGNRLDRETTRHAWVLEHGYGSHGMQIQGITKSRRCWTSVKPWASVGTGCKEREESMGAGMKEA